MGKKKHFSYWKQSDVRTPPTTLNGTEGLLIFEEVRPQILEIKHYPEEHEDGTETYRDLVLYPVPAPESMHTRHFRTPCSKRFNYNLHVYRLSQDVFKDEVALFDRVLGLLVGRGTLELEVTAWGVFGFFTIHRDGFTDELCILDVVEATYTFMKTLGPHLPPKRFIYVERPYATAPYESDLSGKPITTANQQITFTPSEFTLEFWRGVYRDIDMDFYREWFNENHRLKKIPHYITSVVTIKGVDRLPLPILLEICEVLELPITSARNAVVELKMYISYQTERVMIFIDEKTGEFIGMMTGKFAHPSYHLKRIHFKDMEVAKTILHSFLSGLNSSHDVVIKIEDKNPYLQLLKELGFIPTRITYVSEVDYKKPWKR